MKKHNLAELNQLYRESEECDKEIFAEYRSNLLLVSGEHYNKKNSQFWNRVRDAQHLSNEQKLRLTKNHIYKISKIRKNIILSQASGVRVFPNNESELQDQKSAELNQSVWEYAKVQHNVRKLTHEWVDEFFDIGEVAVKVYFDPNAGRFIGYEQEVDELGQGVVDEAGLPVASSRAKFTGDLVFESIYGMNLLRSPQAKRMKDSPFITIRKMITVDKLKELVGDDEDKQSLITATKDETYVVFDASKLGYNRDKDVTTLRETYFRPCMEYPQGYFYIFVEGGILFEGELPFGIWPICYEGHDSIPTTPRHRSPIKQLRPVQIEINRASSAIATTQVVMGDDKLIMLNGSKFSRGLEFPGLRTGTVTGQAPVVIPGRSGEQYFSYLEGQIAELYQLAEIPEALEEKSQGDPWGELFKSARHKQKFIIDAERFEFFLQQVCKTYLDLARHYFDEAFIIPAIGKNEQINISEFKNTTPQSFQIKIEPMSDDLETKFGKSLMINQVLQYSSNQLTREDIGKLLRAAPFANAEMVTADMTMSYDRGTNIILALDRGQQPQPNKYDDGPYIIKRLTARMTQADFMYLSDEIKFNYDGLVQAYEQMEADKQREIAAANADMVPTSGAMIKVGWYVKDPTNPSRSVQATLPASSIEWLVARLEDQGSSQQALLGMNNVGAMSEIAGLYNKQGDGEQGSAFLPAQGGLT